MQNVESIKLDYMNVTRGKYLSYLNVRVDCCVTLEDER